jgi:hypothetical protein
MGLIFRLLPVCFLLFGALVQAARFDLAGTHSIFLKTDGSVWVMGENESGQSGDGTMGGNTLVPKMVALGATAVAAGGYTKYFLKADGTLWGMGDGSSGQLGIGTSSGSSVPVRISDGVVAVAAGDGFGFFLKNDASLWAMGANRSGQLGDGTTINRPVPVKVADDVVKVAAGGAHAGFIKSDGSLWMVGNNGEGRLGDGTMDNRATPVLVAQAAVDVFLGEKTSMYLAADGSLRAMGLGFWVNPPAGPGGHNLLPVVVAERVATASLDGSTYYFVGLDGVLWGGGYDVGNNPESDPFVPRVIAAGVRDVSASGSSLLFTRDDGTLWGYGSNVCAQLGLGGVVGSFSSPIQISTLVPRSVPAPAAPRCSPDGGTLAGARKITLSSATPGATIYFHVPSAGPEWRPYEEPFLLTGPDAVKAVAFLADAPPSAESSTNFAFNSSNVPMVEPPVFRPKSGEYFSNLFEVKITTATPGAEIHYEVDGRLPTPFSPKYEGPVYLLPDVFQTTISARAFKVGMAGSFLRSATYRLLWAGDPTVVAKPVFDTDDLSPTFSRSAKVKISCRTEGADIYYTLDGTDPTAASLRYRRPFTIRATTTVRAIGIKSGLTDSEIAAILFKKK